MEDKCKYASFRFNKPYHTDKGGIYIDTNGYRNNKIPTAFAEILKLIPQGESADCDLEINAKFSNQIGDLYYVIEERLGFALKTLVDEINTGMKAAYDKGKEDGKRALILLNNGEITINDFDKK